MDDRQAPFSVIGLTQKERPADRFLSSQVLTLEHNNQPVTAIIVTEILNPWHPARETGGNLPQTFSRFFGRSSHHSLLTKFEDALKSLNKTLELAREKILTDVNCAILLAAGRDVYFAATGTTEVLLLRNKKISVVSGQDKTDNSFASVTSGELGPTDWIFVTNQEMAGFIRELGASALQQNPEDLEKTLRKAVAADNAAELSGACLALAQDQPTTTFIYLDELESRIPLPRVKLNSFSLPRPNLSAVGSMVSKLPGLARQLLRSVRVVTDYFNSAKKGNRKRALFAGVIAIGLIAVFIWGNHHTPTKSGAEAATTNPLAESFSTDQLRTFLEQNLTENNYNALDQTRQNFIKTAAVAEKTTLLPLGTAVAELPNPIVAFDNVGDNLDQLVIIDNTGQLWSWQNSQLAKLNQSQVISNPLSLAAFSLGKVVVTDTNGNVFLINQSGQVSTLALPTKLASGAKLAGRYTNNLYLYSSADSQIYRVSNFATKLDSATSYLKTPETEVSDWAINGDIFTTNPTGQIKDFRRGNSVAVQFPNNFITDQPIRLATNGDNVAIANNRYIDVTNTSGQIVQSLAIITNAPLSEIAASSKGWWLGSGNKLYLIVTS